MPMGHVDSALYFQAMVVETLKELEGDHCAVWIDDILYYAHTIEDYLKKEFPEQLEIFKNEMLAKQERERLQRLEIQRELNIKRNAAQERRLDGDWNLSNPNIREIGLKANALLEYLVLNGDVQTEDPDGENYVDVYNIVPN
jgi:hypothetical protein